MKMLFFDYRDSEKDFFNENQYSDYEITFYEESLNEFTQLSEKELDETAVISIYIHSQITEKVLDKFKNLFIIITRSTAYNHIDILACEIRNITVLNVEDYGKKSVVQYTIGVMISLLRNIAQSYSDLKQRDIKPSYTGKILSNISVGVIGTGAIGVEVCKILNVFGSKIYAYDLIADPQIVDFVEYTTLDNLCKSSDVITLHIPYTEDTYHILSDNEFELMKDGMYLINTSHGELIDTKSMYKSLLSGKIKGLALDTLECADLNFNNENISEQIEESTCDCLSTAIINQKLLDTENVIITPHIAYSSKEAVNNILYKSFENLQNFYKGDKRCKVI